MTQSNDQTKGENGQNRNGENINYAKYPSHVHLSPSSPLGSDAQTLREYYTQKNNVKSINLEDDGC